MAFSWQLWLALFITTIFVGIILWLFDTIVKGSIAHKGRKAAAAADDLEAAAAEEAAAKSEALIADAAARRGAVEDAVAAAAAAGDEESGAAGKGGAVDASDFATKAKKARVSRRTRWRTTMTRGWDGEKAALQSLGALGGYLSIACGVARAWSLAQLC